MTRNVSQPKITKFGKWQPDLPPMEAEMTEALNVVPLAVGYAPQQGFSPVSSALTARARGAIQTRDDADSVYKFAGDATKLYQNVGDVWTDYSFTTYATATTDVWEFARWKNTVIATNYTDNPQTITLGATAFGNLTTALKFKHIAVIRNFVVAGYVNDTDGETPWRVRWCAFGDPTDWTVAAATLSDYEDLPQKKIQRIFGGEYGVVMQDDAIYRMTFVGAPAVFQFDEVVKDLGLIAPGAATQVGEDIYFLSARGFYALRNGVSLDPIGAGEVDEYIIEDLDQTYLFRMSCAADPNTNRIYWLYPGAGSIDGQPNKLIIYDHVFRKWSHAEENLDLLWQSSGSATTLEQLDTLYGDLDTMEISLDSPVFVGGTSQLGAFDTSFKSGFFDGANLTATLATREMMMHTHGKTKLKGFRHAVSGTEAASTLTARIGYRNDIAEDPSYTHFVSPRSGGRFSFGENRVKARYQRMELQLSGDWRKAIGLMVDPKDMAFGGRRG